MIPDSLVVLYAAVLGALVGSFSNVLIYRLPRGESVAFPPSHCTACAHRLSPLDLVPVGSWVALRGKCRYCRAPISARYPVVETVSALGYATLAALFPWAAYGPSLLGLMILFTVLLVVALIDMATFTVPDELALPGALVGVLFGLVNERTGAAALNLPSFTQAVQGALLGAGAVSLIALFGAWALRRFRERQYPEFPVNYQSVAAAALAGAWLGVWWGAAVGVAAVLLNLAARRPVRIPEALTLGGLLVSLVLAAYGMGPGLIGTVQGAVGAAGAASLLAGVYWWVQSWGKPQGAEEDEGPYDPEAMGFGDVKLAALIGAFIGWPLFLVSLGLAVVSGAVLGVLLMLLGRGNKLPFAPYLALGAVLALLWGDGLLNAYLGLLGL